MHLLLRETRYLGNIRELSAEIIPVPTTQSYSAEPGTLRLASTELKNYVELNVGTVNPDQLPDIVDPSVEQ